MPEYDEDVEVYEEEEDEDEALGGGNGTAFTGMGEMLEGVQGELMQMMRRGAVPETFREHLEAFSTAIKWSEWWIRAILGMHVFLWCAFFLFRKWPRVQSVLFFAVVGLVGSAERLNSLGAKHWRSFATQNYFDERGVFAASVFCAPLLALGFLQLFNFLYEASNLLVEVKRNELKEHRRAKKKGQTEDGTEAVSSSTSSKKDD